MLIAAAKLKKILITIKSTTLTILLLARVECKNMICRHCTLKLLFIIFCLLLTFSGISVIHNYLQLLGTMRKPTTYIVETKGCHIPDLDPWDPIILQHLKTPEKPICKNGKPTLVEKKSNRLYVVPKAVYAYKRKSRDDLQCCHRTFWRHPADYSGDEFKKIYSSECIPFNDTVITDDYKMVECTIGDKEVYRDYFAFVHVKPEIEARCEAAAKEHNAPNISILIMGIDGMSRNHFYRSMPRTLKLLRNMSAVDMAGMNTVRFFNASFNSNNIIIMSNLWHKLYQHSEDHYPYYIPLKYVIILFYFISG
ncbi:hypothetical protein C0J52_06728 [Blattella germanica]|nr:hypothetical protein C0J52_06728 [Blattella germanica]